MVWLEVMLEAGEAFTARRLAELPEELLILALHRQVLVLDVDLLALEMEGGGREMDLLDKALDSCLYLELDRYQLISRRHDGWDAVICAVLALDQEHHDLLGRVLERCADATMEQVERSGGLYTVLSSEEMLEEGAAGERDERRARRGYVEPRDAAAFLALARNTPVARVLESPERDAITAAYFRRLEPGPRPAACVERNDDTTPGLAEFLADAGVIPAQQPQLEAGASAYESPMRQALEALARHDPEGHAPRLAELTYLANVITAGHTLDGRRCRAAEAAELVLDTCTRGLAHASTGQPPEDVLATLGIVRIFRIGWHLS